MPEAYGGVIVDYCLGQRLNANQTEEQAKWNTEKNQGAEIIKKGHGNLFLTPRICNLLYTRSHRFTCS